MRMLFPPRFETLEARKLLSRVHAAIGHRHAVPAATGPIQLDGSLTVNNKAATMTSNADGSSTSTTPVTGKLGDMGRVRGVWVEATDQFGNPTGFDTLRLSNGKGSVVIAFSGQNSARPVSAGKGALAYQRSQQVADVPGAYARVSEKGTLELITNRAKSAIVNIVVTTAQT